ncbi:prepropeptide lignin peroxidase [Trametes versicolor FP-101664 SS1]|uniref:prepropeptide lignin peroxidase n=1 Tax=Trametes versicolor (strain FP-101664) TaxID=717944 RepID=UPI0004623E70|nr:prepropeptide lignin peroxidase [Trametes versicolor FP-101664 SS1]EIW53199.1 prepropeptide lignin peroxidase [Trametes versicolor FP-101664 SS1]
MAFKSLLTFVSLAATLSGTYAALTRRVACPDGVNTATNAACCQLFAVREDLQQNLFHGGLCTAEAHESLRLTFHDGIAISPALQSQGQFGGGGADGSISIFPDIETGFHPNIGLDEIVALQQPLFERHNLSHADFLHFAGAIAASNCAGAPQLVAYVGRKDATQPAPDGLVPEPFHTPDQIFDRLADASQGEFDPILTVWLLTAHTVAAANDVDPTESGLPFDSTPELWDTQFFLETQLRGTAFPGSGGNQGEVESPLAGEMRLQSDHTIARDSRTACEWQSFVDNQPKAQAMFQFVFNVLTTLGQDQNDLVNCTEVVPIPAPPQGHTHFPAGLSIADIEQACAETPFPTLPTDPGPRTAVAPVPKPPPASI